MAAGIRLYGLANCDTCRAARDWAADLGLAVDFSDLRATPVTAAKLAAWLAELGAAALVNRRSTTWRNLGDADRALAGSETGAGHLLAAHPTLIKRPVIEAAGRVSVGFDAETREYLAGLADQA